MQPLKEGKDFYIENGLYVFTEDYHLKRGYCCDSGCRHCPYKKVEDKIEVAVSWSGGKDSALALWYLLQDDRYQVVHLFTVFDEELKRVGLHGTPEHLVEKQAKAMGLPLKKLFLKSSENHGAYEQLMDQYFNKLRQHGTRHVMFGDIFLDDLKKYRDQMLKKTGLKGIYPIWKKDTKVLVRKFISEGFKTAVCAANAKYFSESALGKTIDENFLVELKEGVDPGGENGEFHTFVFDGPIFRNPVKFSIGKVVQKDYEYKILNKEGEEEVQKTTFLFKEFL